MDPFYTPNDGVDYSQFLLYDDMCPKELDMPSTSSAPPSNGPPIIDQGHMEWLETFGPIVSKLFFFAMLVFIVIESLICFLSGLRYSSFGLGRHCQQFGLGLLDEVSRGRRTAGFEEQHALVSACCS